MSHVQPEGSPPALVIELLIWVSARPRTYAETMEAWRTSCPRMPAWEDAICGGLVEVRSSDNAGLSGSAVRLTPAGLDFLASISAGCLGRER
jgi:hypothetical protein